MKRLLLASAIATIALLLNAIVTNWLPGALGLDLKIVQKVKDPEAVGKVLLEQFPETGFYMLPGPGLLEKNAEYGKGLERARKGPVATLDIQRAGCDWSSPAHLTLQALQVFVSILLVGLLLRIATPQLQSYGRRVGYVTLAGMAGAFFVHLALPVSLGLDWRFHVGDLLLCTWYWFITGIILAAFVRTKS